LRRRLRTLWRFSELLPVDPGKAISLGEGGTPISQLTVEGDQLLLKLDFLTPTGSFKDRGSTILISRAKSIGKASVSIDSSGNAAASLSAYAAYAGLKCYVFTPSSASPAKLIQSRATGARVVKVEGSRHDVYGMAKLMSESRGAYYCGFQSNPYALEGMKTIAYEIWEDLAFGAPDWIVLPVGAGNSLLGCWKGFGELARMGFLDKVPRLACVQPECCCPIVDAFDSGRSDVEPSPDEARTVAEGLRIRAPLRGKLILRSLRETRGVACRVTDQEILDAGRLLARAGIFVEPSAAAAMAGARSLLHRHLLEPGNTVIVYLTGSGLKSPEAYGAVEPITLRATEGTATLHNL